VIRFKDPGRDDEIARTLDDPAEIEDEITTLIAALVA
jgi:hypothetical protein